jgi:hypothetical protein
MRNNTAWIRWKTTPKKDLLVLRDLKQLSPGDTLPRKQKPTDFYNPPSGKKIASTEQCHHNRSVLKGCIENIFYCEKNASKFCAEGAIGNLMNILNCSKNDIEQFCDIVTSPVHLILQTLGESSVPKSSIKVWWLM